ncbi:MAG: dihydropteroate synthase [Pseudomonadota bacterium]|nr:dihydropteroate synthase [Pseudomonadota bacterium]
MPRDFSREERVYMRPTGLLSGDIANAAVEAGAARRLAGGRFAFSACEVLLREPQVVTATIAPVGEVAEWADDRAIRLLENLEAPRPPMAGVAMDRPAIMGVINVTPDSFSDGGDNAEEAVAIAQGRAMVEAGAAILDIGGESTRPGSDAVDDATELARVVPVVRGLADVGVPLSIDSRRAQIMAAALDAGATVVNDVSALTYDDASLGTVAASGAPVVLMHTQGDPKTMQRDPTYDCAPLDVYDYLEGRIVACLAAGIERGRMVIDPGIGFGKSPTGHNIEILQRLGLFHGLGCPLLLGVSRKSFIGRLAGIEAPKDRLAGSLAAGLATLDQGVQILRVHDVAETAQAVAVWDALTASHANTGG